jgi:tRNA(Ile)-lysidine synthase
MKLKYPEVILHQLVSRFGFGGDLITQIAHAMRCSGTKKFTSPTHILVIERNKIHVSRMIEETEQVFSLEAGFMEIYKPVKLSAGRVAYNDNIPLKVPQHIALFDEDKLDYPLFVRTWKRGDCFYPFGMKGRKLLSDFFSDHKFDSIQKKNTWILCNNNGDIIWVLGYRADRRFCVDEQTRHILRLELT